MTGIVLALAGLVAGDGGPGTGAATAPAEVGFNAEWTGTWENLWWSDPCRADLRDGVLRVFDSVEGVQLTGRIRIDGRGTVRALDPWGRSILGIYKIEGRRLIICIGVIVDLPRPTRFRAESDTHLLTLHPAD
jgi:hypothetical protein